MTNVHENVGERNDANRKLSGVRPFGELVRRAQLAPPDALAEMIATALEPFGGYDIVLSVIDYEQASLHPVVGGAERQAVNMGEPVVGTMSGRCFTSQRLLEAARPAGTRVWVPVTERAERIGVLALSVDSVDDDVRRFCVELGLVVAKHVTAAGQYTDAYHLIRRRRGMDLSAEMQWDLLPPLAFSSEIVSVAGLLEPAYEVGGDAFDYAVNGGALDFLIIDAVGHSLESSLIGALTIGAYRHCRREGSGLCDLFAAMSGVISEQFGEESYVTALLGRLNCRTGIVEWIPAGHAPPLHLRGGQVVGELACAPSMPLGMAVDVVEIGRVQLEPHDRVVLYTDGVVDARPEKGDEFGEERLRELLTREAPPERSLPEVLRRTADAVIQHRAGDLVDDATLLMFEWPPQPTAQLSPLSPGSADASGASPHPAPAQ